MLLVIWKCFTTSFAAGDGKEPPGDDAEQQSSKEIGSSSSRHARDDRRRSEAETGDAPTGIGINQPEAGRGQQAFQR